MAKDAYSENASNEQLIGLLLTSDGQGKKVKKDALRELLSRVDTSEWGIEIFEDLFNKVDVA